MTTEITPRAIAVLRRGFQAARLDPAQAAVRIRLAGGAARTEFAEQPEPGDDVIEVEGMRVFLDTSVAGRVIDVSEEHDQIVLR